MDTFKSPSGQYADLESVDTRQEPPEWDGWSDDTQCTYKQLQIADTSLGFTYWYIR